MAESLADLARAVAAHRDEIAGLRAIIAEQGNKIDELQKRPALSDADTDLDGEPWPAGTWRRIKQAAGETKFSESGIYAMIRRDQVLRRMRGGRVFVRIEDIENVKKRKNEMHTFLPSVSRSHGKRSSSQSSSLGKVPPQSHGK